MQTTIKNKVVTQSSVVYGMGLIGAAIYYIQHSISFWSGVVGLLKALIWPGMLIYRLMEFLNM